MLMLTRCTKSLIRFWPPHNACHKLLGDSFTNYPEKLTEGLISSSCLHLQMPQAKWHRCPSAFEVIWISLGHFSGVEIWIPELWEWSTFQVKSLHKKEQKPEWSWWGEKSWLRVRKESRLCVSCVSVKLSAIMDNANHLLHNTLFGQRSSCHEQLILVCSRTEEDPFSLEPLDSLTTSNLFVCYSSCVLSVPFTCSYVQYQMIDFLLLRLWFLNLIFYHFVCELQDTVLIDLTLNDSSFFDLVQQWP